MEFQERRTSLYGPPIKIGAFNIRVFGKTKASKAHIMQSLVQVKYEWKLGKLHLDLHYYILVHQTDKSLFITVLV